MNRILGRSKSSPVVSRLLKQDKTKVLTDSKDIGNEFNSYFANVDSDLHQNIPQTNECPSVPISGPRNSIKLVFRLFIDLSKAFHLVDHGVLLRKLYNIGIRAHSNDLLRSYLYGRSQCVRIGDTLSETMDII